MKRETGREEEKHRRVASCMCPDQGLNLQPRQVPCPGIEPATLCLALRHSGKAQILNM